MGRFGLWASPVQVVQIVTASLRTACCSCLTAIVRPLPWPMETIAQCHLWACLSFGAPVLSGSEVCGGASSAACCTAESCGAGSASSNG